MSTAPCCVLLAPGGPPAPPDSASQTQSPFLFLFPVLQLGHARESLLPCLCWRWSTPQTHGLPGRSADFHGFWASERLCSALHPGRCSAAFPFLWLFVSPLACLFIIFNEITMWNWPIIGSAVTVMCPSCLTLLHVLSLPIRVDNEESHQANCAVAHHRITVQFKLMLPVCPHSPRTHLSMHVTSVSKHPSAGGYPGQLMQAAYVLHLPP